MTNFLTFLCVLLKTLPNSFNLGKTVLPQVSKYYYICQNCLDLVLKKYTENYCIAYSSKLEQGERILHAAEGH